MCYTFPSPLAAAFGWWVIGWVKHYPSDRSLTILEVVSYGLSYDW